MEQASRDAATRRPLGQILVKGGLISHAELERALKLQGHSGEKLGRILAAWGLVSWEQIHRALDAQKPR